MNETGDALTRVAVAACALYAAFLVASTPHAVGGADSSGYINQARMLAAGELVVPVRGLQELELGPEWLRAFTPLGFLPHHDSAAMVPLYPPGLSVLIAASAALFGWDQGPFLLPGLFAGIGVALLYLTARLLGMDRSIALSAGAVLAVWPAYVHFGVQLMGDTVTTAFSIGAVLLAILATRDRFADAAAVASGAVFVFSVVIRPSNILLAPALATLMLAAPRRVAGFLIGGLPIGLPWLAYNSTLYGHPLSTGYSTTLGADMGWSNFIERATFYLPWLAATLPAPMLGWLVALRSPAIARRTRLLVATWFVAFLAFYLFYGNFRAWWYLRFLSPAVPALLIGAGLALQAALGKRAPADRRRLVALVAAMSIAIPLWHGWRVEPIEGVQFQEHFVDGTAWLDDLPEGSLIAAMQFSGAIYYYTPRIGVNYVWMDASSFDRLRAETELRGHVWYALLERWEADAIASRMPGDWQQVAAQRRIRLWRLPPRPARENAELRRADLDDALTRVATLDDPPRVTVLQRRLRRAYRSLRDQDDAAARPLLRTLQRSLSELARERPQLGPVEARVRLWGLYLAARGVDPAPSR